MAGYSKDVLDPGQIVRFKTVDRFLSYFGTEPRRLNEPVPIYLLISIKAGQGSCYIDNTYVQLKAGSLLLVGPYSFLHMANAGFLLGSVIIFTERFFCTGFFYETLLYKVAYEPVSRPVVQFGGEPEKEAFINANMKMFGIQYQLNKEAGNKNEWLSNTLSSILLLLHGRQLANVDGRYDSHNQHEKSNLVSFIRLVNLHFKEQTALAFYAKQLHITVDQLTEDCKKAYAWTPKAIIQAKLLVEAKRLLTYDPRPIDAIGDELGFGDNSAFIRFFRQLTHQSPKEYREDSVVAINHQRL